MATYSQKLQQIQLFLNDSIKKFDTFTEEAAKCSQVSDHYAFVSGKEESINEMAQRVKELEELARKIRKEEANEKAVEESLSDALERLRAKEKNLQEKVVRRKQAMEKGKEENENLRRELSKQEASKKKSLGVYRQPMEVFSTNLGLDIKRVGDGVMRITFTMIDPDDEARKFYFNFRLEERIYHMDDCNPPLPTTEVVTLVKELNATNQLGIFVRSIRKLFKQQVRQEKELRA